MSENRDMDNIFREGLMKERSFHRADEQWTIVANRLNQDSDRRRTWWFFLGTVSVVFLSLTIYKFTFNNASTNIVSITDDITAEVERHQSSIDNKSTENSNPKAEISEKSSDTEFSNSNSQVLQNTDLQYSYSKDDKLEEEHTNLIDQGQQIIDSDLEPHEFEQSISDPDFESKPNPVLNKETTVLKRPSNDENLSRQPILLSYLTKPVNTLEKEDHIFPKMIINPSIHEKQKVGIAFGAGVFYEMIRERSVLEDQSKVGYFLGAQIQYSIFNFGLMYKRNNLNRTIFGELDAFSIPDTNFIYGYDYPENTAISYTNHIFDLSLGVNVYRSSGINFRLDGGVQMRYLRDGNITYDYGGIYNPIIRESQFDSQGFQLSDFYIGSGLDIYLSSSFSLSFNYKYLQPRKLSEIYWSGRHHFELGLMYQLKRKK